MSKLVDKGLEKFSITKNAVLQELGIVDEAAAHAILKELEDIVLTLYHLIRNNNWLKKFEDAFSVVRQHAAKIKGSTIAHITTVEQYIEWLYRFLVWIPDEDQAGKKIYSRLCEFYYILDQDGLLELQNPIKPFDTPQPLTPLSSWMVDFAKAVGRFLDTTASINEKSLKTFQDSPLFDLDSYMPPPSGYLTFNQLFARHVKPGARPISNPEDDLVVVSPADSTPVVWDVTISDDSAITVDLKGLTWSIKELLQDSKYKENFAGGTFTHSFLNTFDYHRLHVPIAGKVLESKFIPGQVYLEVVAQEDSGHTAQSDLQNISHVPDAVLSRNAARSAALASGGPLKLTAVRGKPHDSVRNATLAVAGTGVEDPEKWVADDNTGYQFAQARGLCVLETRYGLVAILPIGMAQVSSVIMTAPVGAQLQKGEEFAYFQFGGSDHIVLFSKGMNPDYTTKFKNMCHHKQGEIIAKLHPNK